MNDYKLGHAALQKTAVSKTQTRAQREDGRGIVIAPTDKDIGNFVEEREAFGVGHSWRRWSKIPRTSVSFVYPNTRA